MLCKADINVNSKGRRRSTPYSSVYYFSARKKKHTGDNSERAELTKSTATTIVTNKIGVSVDNCTLTQKSKEKVGERKHTLYKLYTVIHTLF